MNWWLWIVIVWILIGGLTFFILEKENDYIEYIDRIEINRSEFIEPINTYNVSYNNETFSRRIFYTENFTWDYNYSHLPVGKNSKCECDYNNFTHKMENCTCTVPY